MTKAILKMMNLEGRVVVTRTIDVGSVDSEGLKIAEKAQNEVLAKMGFQGYCKIEAAAEGATE